MQHAFFYLGLSFIVMHEMDAVRCREWRIFPGLSLLGDKTGFVAFMLAHVPLYFLLFRELVAGGNPAKAMRGLDAFFIIHLGLHLLFLRHPKNEFKDSLSWVIIAGAAVCGAIDIFMQ